jgi:hypothetical protein
VGRLAFNDQVVFNGFNTISLRGNLPSRGD